MVPYILPVIAMLLLSYAVLVEPYHPVVTDNSFRLFSSGGAGAGGAVRVVFISDIHDSYDDPGYISAVVDMVDSQQPDLILIGGDVVGGEAGVGDLSALAGLKARYGVFAVLGNHDYHRWGCGDLAFADKVAGRLEGMGITVLRNDHRLLDINNSRFALVGVDDLWSCRSDYDAAAAGIPADMPRVVLAHESLSVAGKALEGRNLVLSGHTHCGQVRIPFVTDAIVRYLGFGNITGGRARLSDDDEVYVTCGVVPGGIRLFAPPEVSVIELTG